MQLRRFIAMETVNIDSLLTENKTSETGMFVYNLNILVRQVLSERKR